MCSSDLDEATSGVDTARLRTELCTFLGRNGDGAFIDIDASAKRAFPTRGRAGHRSHGTVGVSRLADQARSGVDLLRTIAEIRVLDRSHVRVGICDGAADVRHAARLATEPAFSLGATSTLTCVRRDIVLGDEVKAANTRVSGDGAVCGGGNADGEVQVGSNCQRTAVVNLTSGVGDRFPVAITTETIVFIEITSDEVITGFASVIGLGTVNDRVFCDGGVGSTIEIGNGDSICRSSDRTALGGVTHVITVVS